MPSPAPPYRSSNNRGGSAKTTPAKSSTTTPLDIGQPLGIHDTNSVREKVRKWQRQGGGVIHANDCLYYDEDEENSTTTATAPTTTATTTITTPTTPTKSRPIKPATDRDVSADSRPRSHSTPRKRLISDEHWKLNRLSTQTPPPKLPPATRVSQYTTNDSFASSPQAARKEGLKDEKVKIAPLSRSRERSKTLATDESANRDRRKSKPPRDVDSRIVRTIDEEENVTHSDRPQSAPRSQTGDESDTRAKSQHHDSDSDWAAISANFSELSRRRARGPDPKAKESKDRKDLKPRASVNVPKNGIFGHIVDESKRMFARPEPPKSAAAPPRGAKIEAWLCETPDPFLDHDVESDVEIPAPLNTRANRKRPQKKDDSGHDRINETEPSVDGSRRSSPRDRRSKGKEDLSTVERPKSAGETKGPSKEQREKDASPPSHRRRSSGHRHSKSAPSVKESKIADKVSEEKPELLDGHSTHPLSDGSEVSGNNPPVPLGRKRPFPSTGGHRLSTIMSFESASTRDDASRSETKRSGSPEKRRSPSSRKTAETTDAEERDQFDPESLPVVSSQLRRRLTTHDDLISVLSLPNSSRSLRSARSIRTNKSRLATATVSDLLKEFSLDETKYMRELKTLVGGVIPVLLTCVLSRSDSAIAAGLFRPAMDPKDELNFTKPIVDMGIAIERLKTLHKRIPQDNADSLLTWAQGAQRVYRDYLKAWRLGFRDVIVNLAPLEEDEATEDAETKSLDEGMARDENGDVVDSNGEKVDVAYLLKRPLVRLKYLAKTFKGVNMLQPSPKAEETATAYQSLVTEARRRAREERARLEDESASAVDSTRARDPSTLGVLADVTIDRTRRVRARDFFSLTLYHSSGQVIDCRGELLLRDKVNASTPGGDLLICEIDHADRWLLFPPIDLACVSARSGDSKGEIVLMIRSPAGQVKPWHELLFLRIDEEDVGLEWVKMLGLNPIPPSISRTQSFLDRAKQRQREQREQASSSAEPPASPKVTPNPSDVDVPIGEKPTGRPARPSSISREPVSEPSTVDASSAVESKVSSYSAITRDSDYASAGAEKIQPSTPSQPSILHSRDPRRAAGDDNVSGGLKRSKAKRMSRIGESSTPASPASPGLTPAKTPVADRDNAAALVSPHRYYDDVKRESKPHNEHYSPKTPTHDHPEPESPRVSSVPSMDLPLIPKLRPGSSPSYASESLQSVSDEEDYDYLPERPTRAKGHSRSGSDSSQNDNDAPPPPPPHRSPSPSTGSGLSNTPVLSPAGVRLKRRGSSPLKHEYEPSTDGYSDSDTSTVRHYEMYSESDYSASDTSDDESEDELPRVSTRDLKPTAPSAPSSVSPSQSVSQGGYRSVPAQPSKSAKTIASVFGWSDRGSWESLLPDECSIVVSPGLIEAYRIIAGVTSPDDDEQRPNRERPVVALELTPLVPIRRGTAIDISIRSPPAERSKYTWTNNIMFRSRNPDECEALYGLINTARINNPTYIALQNARGPFADQPTPVERSERTRTFGWPRRRKSYRASNSPKSLADHSESSVGTMSSAFSALKRFGGSKMFSISRSTVTSRKDGSQHSSALTSHSPRTGLGRIAAAIKGMDGIGLSNAKIRLYYRESSTKWRDMGAARLTIMPAAPRDPPPPPTTAPPTRPGTSGSEGSSTSPPASGSASPRRGIETEKRILIRGKTRGEVLLDVCLGESAFERVARTGIAVSIREENENGAVAKQGGVTNGSSKIYMVQMKSEAEAAYTFGLVGKMKY